MKKYFDPVKAYISAHKKEFIIGGSIVSGLLVLAVLVIAVFAIIDALKPKVVYTPVDACEVLTINEARELMGGNTLKSGMKRPTILGNLAASNCGYTDGNPDTDNLVVAAIIVRSGVNDKGVDQNKREFDEGRPADNTQTVNGLGKKAYFNEVNGQLNILTERDWIVLSYGVGQSPESNTIEKAVELAHKVVR